MVFRLSTGPPIQQSKYWESNAVDPGSKLDMAMPSPTAAAFASTHMPLRRTEMGAILSTHESVGLPSDPTNQVNPVGNTWRPFGVISCFDRDFCIRPPPVLNSRRIIDPPSLSILLLVTIPIRSTHGIHTRVGKGIGRLIGTTGCWGAQWIHLPHRDMSDGSNASDASPPIGLGHFWLVIQVSTPQKAPGPRA